MSGDGVNDGVGLALANIEISGGSGSDISAKNSRHYIGEKQSKRDRKPDCDWQSHLEKNDIEPIMDSLLQTFLPSLSQQVFSIAKASC